MASRDCPQLAASPSRACGICYNLIMLDNAASKPRPHHRRYAGYDYTRGASLFITVATEPRQPLFGTIFGAEGVTLSPFGVIAEAALAEAEAHFAGITVVMQVIMPDHVHFRIVLAKDMPEPVRLIGAFVGRFKQFSQWRIAQAGGPAHIWEKGYHDHICLSRQMRSLPSARVVLQRATYTSPPSSRPESMRPIVR